MYAGRTGGGSEIQVLLPAAAAAKAVVPALAETESTAAPAAVEPAQPAGGSVLVVEDEGGIRSLVKKILTREGYKVIDAASAEEARDAVRLRSIDLLIVDLVLGKASGRELANQLLEKRPNLRVLYISVYSDSAERVTSSLGPRAGFLQKLFTLTALVRKVREVFEPPPAAVPIGEWRCGAGACS